MNAVTINNLTVTLAQIANFAPKVILHGQEKCFPCSIEYLLTNATLVSDDPNQLPVNGSGQTVPSISNPTQADLFRNCADNYRVQISSTQFAGQPPAEDGTIPAPMYVSVQTPPDQSFVDLTYIFLFAYQDAQAARAIQVSKLLAGGKFNFQLPHFGEHEADLECVTVRVTPDFNSLVFVRYEAHGHSTYYGSADIDFDGSHPLVYCALNDHGTYNGKGKNDIDWFVTETHAPFVAFIDLIDKGGPVWQPYQDPSQWEQNLLIVGLDGNGNLINSAQPWTKYSGHLGAQQQNEYQGATAVGPVPLTNQQVIVANSLEALADKAGKIPASRKVGDGTNGLGERRYIVANEPFSEETYVIWSQLAENLVLSVDPTNPAGNLILAALQSKQPAQRWIRLPCANQSYALVNELSGLIAYFSSATQPIGQVPLSQMNNTSQWTLGDDQGGGFMAIRPAITKAQNMDVPGSKPSAGSVIYAGSWQNGKPLELWRFDLVMEEQQVYVHSKLGENLVLSVDQNNPTGDLIIDTWDLDEPAQIWKIAPTANGYAMVNMLSGQAACYERLYGDVAQAPFPNQLTSNSAWTSSDDSGGFVAIRPVATSQQNLAVVNGNASAGAAVYTTSWSDDNNDPALWRFDLVTEYPSFYIQSKLSPTVVLSVDPNNPTGDLVIDTYQPGQPAQSWQQIPTTDGYALVNALSGLAACYTRNEGDVMQVDFSELSQNSTWTLSNESVGSFTAIRPVSNSDENLNIFNSTIAPLPIKICTWSWGGGNHDNALWLLIPAD